MAKSRKINGGKPDGKPLHYKACGLDDVYLVNGFKREVIDGEEYIRIENLKSLWKAIGLHLVSKKKVLAPKELRFLRDQMDLTQAELGSLLRVSDQSVARWEKGKCDAGSADIAIRFLYLDSDAAQPEGRIALQHIRKMVEEIVESDEPVTEVVAFRHSGIKWNETQTPRQLATA
jgi:DNA-binding transcriptional regulator YiaG